MEIIGAGFLMQSLQEPAGDRRFMADEMRLAVLADELGFDYVSFPEHHFVSFSFSPNPLQLLTWVAARTERINLMPAVVVLPWHDPLRVVEEAAVLDTLSGGRLWMGIGRGFARREYEGFRVDRQEARERFDEAAEFVKRALETGVAEGNGPHYRQPAVEIRPAPFKSFAGRFFSVANSPDSAVLAGRIGARMMHFVAGRADQTLVDHVENYRSAYRQHNDGEPPPVLLSDATLCTRDPDLVRRAREEWYPNNHRGIVEHYEFDSAEGDAARVRGYDDPNRRHGPSSLGATAFADSQVWGSPEQIVDAYRDRMRVLGDVDAHFIFRHGAIPAEVSEASMRLFAEDALPALRELTHTADSSGSARSPDR